MENEKAVISLNTTECSCNTPKCRPNDKYDEFSESVKNHFSAVTLTDGILYRTDVKDLFEVFLDNLPADARQHYNCNACRHFINNFGGLVIINENGKKKSAIWDDKNTPEFFLPSVKAMLKIINKAPVNGVFFSSEAVLGTPVTGEWSHLSITLPKGTYLSQAFDSDYAATAQKYQEYIMLQTSLSAYTAEHAKQAVFLLKTDALVRSEKCIGVAEWFSALHEKLAGIKNSKDRDNIIWRAVATAPTGFCHVKSSMIGTLLDDIVAGLPVEEISRKFAEKMDPTKYQISQVPPSKGNIDQAERIFAERGLKNSLRRRYARLDEIEKIWSPKEENKPKTADGIFSHLLPKETENKTKLYKAKPEVMTWRKFSENILPLAEKIQLEVQTGGWNFGAIVTAADFDAPPIIQWDTAEVRNPFSWYLYPYGTNYRNWNLDLGYCDVTAISLQPNLWYGNKSINFGNSIFFILKGAKDVNCNDCGIALFPEILKSEFHEIRSTITAYSKEARLENTEDASACGLILSDGQKPVKLKVETSGGIATYEIDRLD